MIIFRGSILGMGQGKIHVLRAIGMGRERVANHPDGLKVIIAALSPCFQQ